MGKFGFDHFTMTAEHVALIRRMRIGWQDCEFGAPEVDPKRPYGNSDVPRDMAEILGIKWKRDEDDDYMPRELQERLRRLHQETEQALQVAIDTGTFQSGNYRREKYVGRWERVT